MHNLRVRLLALSAVLAVVAAAAPLVWQGCSCSAGDLPQPAGWVNDFANVLSLEDEASIASLIKTLEEKTGAEIAVVTLDTTQPRDEMAYARELFDLWQPGKEGKDNGVLVLLAVRDRTWRIESGYGAEAALPDGLAGEIGRECMVPEFKKGNFGKGLYDGVLRIAGVLARDAGVPDVFPSVGSQAAHDDVPGAAVVFVLILAVILLIVFIEIARTSNRLGGGSGSSWPSGRSPGGFGGGFRGGGGGFGGFGGGRGGGGGAGGRF